jgi:endogenous inhibitor of DNA gyrase (YacG/DUF329 family)
MADAASDPSDVLMLHGVAATCADCGDERVFVPTSDDTREFCCTACDAAVFLLSVAEARVVALEDSLRRA